MNDPIAEDIAAVGRIDAVPKILEVVCRLTGMRFAAVARVTAERWVACAVRDEIEFGLVPGGELELASTICDEIRQSGQAVVIDHVAQSVEFCDHHTPRQYGLQSYISTPIYHRGEFFGTLCAIDPAPAPLHSIEALQTFELFADLIGSHLDAQDRLAQSEAALQVERRTSELREQFIAVLGHDLRNPLAAFDGGARLLAKTPLNERAHMILEQMRGSARRMAGLIDNVMDMARGQLGGGLNVEFAEAVDIDAVLTGVVGEFRAARPERVIELDIATSRPIAADARRIAQLFSNLIANALNHGAEDAPVRVSCRIDDEAFAFSVANAGVPVKPEVLPKLFQPYVRAVEGAHKQGLGLGLYIASEIARAHGGALTAASDEAETRFTYRQALGQP
jgi:signal transduction histidine kinase